MLTASLLPESAHHSALHFAATHTSCTPNGEVKLDNVQGSMHDEDKEAYCMQEHVSVSRTDLIVPSPACKVIVLSSTSAGVFVYSTRLVPLSAHLLI